MKACGKNYGALPAMCRRFSRHEGECGPGDEVERALIRAYEVTAYLREQIRKTKDVGADIRMMVLRDFPQPPAPPVGTGGTTPSTKGPTP